MGWGPRQSRGGLGRVLGVFGPGGLLSCARREDCGDECWLLSLRRTPGLSGTTTPSAKDRVWCVRSQVRVESCPVPDPESCRSTLRRCRLPPTY